MNHSRRILIFLVLLSGSLSACGSRAVEPPLTNALVAEPVISTEVIETIPEALPPEGAELTYPVLVGQPMVLFGLAEGEKLPVFSEAGGGDLIGEIALEDQVVTTAQIEAVAGVDWLQLELPAGVGWADAQYLTEAVSAEDFCFRDDVQVLVADLMAAVALHDGSFLSNLTSPVHGLTIYHEWWNPPVSFARGEAGELFAAQDVYDWGVQDGSGLPIAGSFSEIILPKLDDAFSRYPSLHCNDIAGGTGPSAGYKVLPIGYENINYYVLYRAAPAEQEMDWRAWVIGIDFVQGKPYLLFIAQYHWEI